MNWHEVTRMDRLREVYGEENVWFPLSEKPYVENEDIDEYFLSQGVQKPHLYTLDYDHNNCGGRCVKAGIKHWKKLLQTHPDRYAEVEERERLFQEHIGKKVTILKDRRNGGFLPMSLTELRERVHVKPTIGDNESEGGCGCYVASIIDNDLGEGD